MSTAFQGLRTIDHYIQTIDATPERIHELICPVREAEWAEGWSARVLHAPSGLAEENGVYATDDGNAAGPTVWFITRRDPKRHETEFVYFAPAIQVVRITVRIEALDAHRSQVLITYIRTGITEAGNAVIAEARRTGAFLSMVTHWERAMNHYLATGELLEAA